MPGTSPSRAVWTRSSAPRAKQGEPGRESTPGKLLYGRFEVLAQLGQGSFGRVLHCLDHDAKLEVALKQAHSAGADALLGFKREFRALSDVHHTNLVRLFELFEADAAPCAFSMELVPGLQLLDWVRDAEQTAGFDEQRLRTALVQIVQGLQALHGLGLLHRDLKPDNIRVTPEGRVVLLDFGLCALGPGGKPNQWGSAGTVAYMAPEQTERRHGPPVDLYALGVTLYEALTGTLPFSGDGLLILMRKSCELAPSPRALCPEVPEDLDRLCQALLEVDPELRATAAAVLERLGVQSEASAPLQLGSRHSMLVPRHFVGREQELRDLDGLYERARHQGLQVALLEGASGIGKTELMEAWKRRQQSRQPDLLVLEGRCHAAEQLNFKMWDGLIDRLCEYLDTLAPEQLKALLPSQPDRLAGLFPVLQRLEGVTWQASRADADPVAERFSAFRALAELLRRVAAFRPLVLCVDDLQWGDEDSLALLQVLGSSDDNPNLLLLATMRPLPEMEPRLREALTRLMAQQQHFERVPVTALSAGECAEMTARLMDREQDDAAVQRVVRETGGHPWFAAEMARLAEGHEGGLDHRGLDDALRERALRLGEGPRVVLTLLAAAGGPVRPAVVHSALGLSAQAAAEAVSLLRAHRLVRSVSGGRVACYHDRVREAVLTGLSAGDIRGLNVRLAEVSRAHGADPLTIAGYWIAAGQLAQALPWLERAVDAAEAAGAYASAAQLYARMIECHAAQSSSAPELRELGLRRAEALASAGRCAESAQLLLALLEDCGTEERSRLQVRAAERLLQAGQVAAGLDAARSAFVTLDMSWPATPKAASRKERWHRALLRLRGVKPGRVGRAPDDLDVARLAALAQLTHPMTWIDAARAGELSARYLRLALDAGDQAHALRALVCQALIATGRIPAVFEMAQAFLEPQQDAELWAFWHYACGWEGWPEQSAAVASLERSEALYRSGAPRAAWALSNVQAARLRRQYPIAPGRAWAAEVEQRAAEASLRGDSFVSALISVSAFGALRHLQVDQPQRAVAEIKRVMGDWDSAHAEGGQTANATILTSYRP